MSKLIHKTAIVSSKAVLGKDVSVGPYAIIGGLAKIGNSTQIDAFAQIQGNTEIGKNCHIFSYALIGNPPQDLKYKGEKSFIVIGDNNCIREFITINPGTHQGSKTVIGNNNLFMAYSHVAHDCSIGSDNIFANNATLAGHVEVGSRTVIGGLSAVHQFCRVGDLAIIGGCSKVVQDVAPYSICDGHPAIVCGLNSIGLKRAKASQEVITELKKVYKMLFFENHPFDAAKELVKTKSKDLPEIRYLLDFLSSSKRGIGR